MQHQFKKRAILWSLPYIFIAVYQIAIFPLFSWNPEIDFIDHITMKNTNETFFDKKYLIAFLMGLDTLFGIFFRKGMAIDGKYLKDLRTVAIKTSFVIFAMLIIPTALYVFATIYWTSAGIAFIIFNLLPVIFLLLTACFPRYYFTHEHSLCPKCTTIAFGNLNYAGSRSYTTTTTTTTNEKVADIYSKNTSIRSHLEVYADVTRTETDTTTTYDYRRKFHCPNCHCEWGDIIGLSEYHPEYNLK